MLEKSPALQVLVEAIKQEPSLLIEELWDAPKAALLSLLLKSGKSLLVIGASSMDKLHDDASYFLKTPPLDFPPADELFPSPDIIGKRMETLYHLVTEKKPHVILASLQACLQTLPSPSTLKSSCFELKVGNEIPFETLTQTLSDLGYRRAPVVSDKGEYAIRGGILDLFPLSSTDPYRLEFNGDLIEQIRKFDPISQKSIEKHRSLFVSPATEQKEGATLLDYLGKETVIIFNDLLAIEDQYVSLKIPLMDQIAPLQKIWWSEHPIEKLGLVEMKKRLGRSFYSGKTPLQPLTFELFNQTHETKRFLHPFREITDFFSPYENKMAATAEELLLGLSRPHTLEVTYLAATDVEEKNLLEKIPNAKIQQGYLSSGFVLADGNVALIPMTEFSHRLRPRRQKWRNTYHTPASDFHQLAAGDVVVHFHNGIGQYVGIEKRPNHLGAETEFMVISYAEKSKLYVPVSQSHLVSRYIGVKEEVPTLSALGSTRWQKTRAQAQQAILGYAQQLIEAQARREIAGGFAFGPDSEETALFENDFPFVETEDQLHAIAEIKKEMTSSKTMDRLICGDVGYGKTEVAMRAAFKAVADGKKQVAVLVPTTILALQHYETFSARMANFPIKIAHVSRFRSTAEVKKTLKETAEGKIDILIGTHRIIGKDVTFKDLGLIIIDEEQRFGVRAKEHLKTLKSGVDCLTLSATPIPRTLYLSLVGAKSISVINTPPQDRLPIKSILSERDPALIQNALLRELSRDGQAFFVHNRVESLYQVAEEIQALLPEARLAVGHGQMSPDELDAVFHSFKSGQADILIATTIVENGIDIPNANTILIDRADTFGMADLYQMRGRVGRWNRPAYAYFLIPRGKALPEISRKRLHALIEASGYGAGMKIAMRDLEIRGAGEILGTQQSGQVASIGFHLYCKLLKRAIDALRKKTKPTFIETKMEFSYDASLPPSYIPESELRMEIYHRIGEAQAPSDLDQILDELKDRFGPYPPAVLWLYHLTRLRLFASSRGYTLLKFDKHTFTAEKPSGKTVLPLPKTSSPKQLESEIITLIS